MQEHLETQIIKNKTGAIDLHEFEKLSVSGPEAHIFSRVQIGVGFMGFFIYLLYRF